MKILYHSAAPWVNTGYGRVTRELAGRLHNDGHEVSIQCLSAIRKGNIDWHGEQSPYELRSPMKVMEAQSQFGLGDVEGHFEETDSDFYFTHFDTWMGPARKKIPQMEIPYGSYVIVDHFPAPNAVVNQVNNAHRVFAMSKYARETLRNKGVRPIYIPHGVDTQTYRPLPKDQRPTAVEVVTDEGEVKEKQLDDIFLVGMVAANHGDRKQIPAQMEAFKRFSDEIPGEAILYLHTEQNSRQGFNLEEVRQEIGLDKSKILWPRSDDYQEVGDEFLNGWYNSFDVFMNCSMGESWGLTITEAQAAGTPCIVTSFSSMPEQLGADPQIEDDWYGFEIEDDTEYSNVDEAPHGLLVEPSMSVFREKVSVKQYLCSPDDVCNALHYYYNNPDLIESHGEKARQHVVDNYDWDEQVFPMWSKEFKNIEQIIA